MDIIGKNVPSGFAGRMADLSQRRLIRLHSASFGKLLPHAFPHGKAAAHFKLDPLM
jgi:hypothetical protein